jgi:hypothetical protein
MYASTPLILPASIAGLCSPSNNQTPAILQENSIGEMKTVVADTIGATITVPAGYTNAPAGNYTEFEFMVPHSASAFVAQSTGAGPSSLPASGTFGLGGISDAGGAPTTTSGCANAAAVCPVVSFYQTSAFARYVFNVLTNAVAVGTGNVEGASTDTILQGLFRSNPTAAAVGTLPANYISPVCQATATISKFGYVNIDAATNGASGLSLCGTVRNHAWETPSATFS